MLQGVELPRRLTALLEGESLLNDATGLVLFRFAVAATLSGVFSASDAAQSFAILAIGGVLAGLAVGAAWVFIVRRLNSEMLILVTTMLMSWAAYILGEAIHVSGVIAVVTAGLMLGWYQHVVFPATVRLRGNAFWQIMVFVLEALVFILIGFSLRGVLERVGGIEAVTTTFAGPIVAIVLAVIVARFVWIFASDALLSGLRAAGLKQARPLGVRQATVLGWAGMRGVVTLAVALTLPAQMPGRDFMLLTAFAVIFATVVLQGTSLGRVIALVKPVDKEPPAKLDLPATEAAITRARHAEVERRAYGPDGTLEHPVLLEQSQRRLNAVEKYAQDSDRAMVRFREHFDLQRHAIAAARAELIQVHRAGLIEDETLHNLERDLDVEEMGLILQSQD
ncbi:cation:proton antiporter [Sphingomonas rhizophila]|uniref:cation:proton antiporter n=1 Tax=Sphingomonas rhizophila TaxID=2071607 RepID=UPI002483C96F|nr:sodium:proton antiporter [Sphingomonas rhizophila]